MISYLPVSVARIKWLLPLLFIAGYIMTVDHFEGATLEYSAYSLLALTSCVVVLTQLDLFERDCFATWFALVLLVMGYFVRFYWVTLDPWPVERMLPWNPFRTMIANREALLEAFKFSTVAFASFSGAAASLLYLSRTPARPGPASSCGDLHSGAGNAATWMLIGLVLLMFALAYLSYEYKIGEMGASAPDALPFRIKGVVFYARTVSLPLALLLCIYLAEHGGKFMVSRAGILALLAHGVTDMLLRNSRSSLLLVLLLLAFLVLAGGLRLRTGEKVLFGVLATAAILAVPVMTEYRQIRLLQGLPHMDALSGAINVANENWLLQFFKGLKFVLFRVPGIESLWCEIALGARPLGIYSLEIINSKNGIAGYLTYAIHPMKEGDNTLLAPGFVGWFFLVAGAPAIVVGALLTGAVSVLGWKYLGARYILSGPVAQAFLLWILFIALTEGTLDSMLLMLLAGMATVVVMEAVLRLLAKFTVMRCNSA
jgi:hypothetical protein